MDYGLRLTTPCEVPTDPREACSPEWRVLLPPGRAVALYFGTEFCEDRLPDLDDANAYCAVARAHASAVSRASCKPAGEVSEVAA